MTDQAVDFDGGTTPGETAPPAPGNPRGSEPANSQFLGRHTELKELAADIERTGLDTLAGRGPARPRVLLIAGRPGSGRTALAEELLRQVAERYPGGVLRARLTEPDGTRVPTARTARELLDALGVPTPPGTAEDDLTAALRTALTGRRTALLLDGAADAAQVEPLLPDAPGCLFLAVTAGPLTGIPDVRPCTLGGLDTKAALELLGRHTGSVRITCDPRAAEGLVELCGAQPAALLLAGGWLAARPKASVADLAKRLHTRPDEGPALDRLLDQVYADLPPTAARILRLLCLAPAGLTDPHTASALAGCTVSAAAESLHDFAGRGLLRPAAGEPVQYRVPDCLVPLLRRYMERQDRPAEIQLARARMLERTVRLLGSCRAVTEPAGSPARRRLAGLPRALRFEDRRGACRWLDSRRPALLAAARTAVAEGDLDTLARRLIAALVRALTAHHGSRAAAPELYGLHELVLDVAERRDLHRERAAALLNLADLDAHNGRTRDALVRYRTALDAARTAGDPYATGRAMESLGAAHQELGDGARAADWFGRALTERLARGEHADAARLYGRIAGVQTYAGRYGEALRGWRSAIAAYRRAGEVAGQARALIELARVQEYAGRPEESLRTCQEAVDWAKAAGDVRLQAALQVRLADTLDRLGDPAAARLHREAAGRMLGREPEPAGEPVKAPVAAVMSCGDAVTEGRDKESEGETPPSACETGGSSAKD
ncbi:tetratricopeptide repeat protein [Streptomyces sp. NPDC058045]|uniref:tetratricopeptide repeat protein n=1 Tax=Streptomyces sp. NPDC058045 TaxID=3346311 RepID=UPI0036EF6D6E